MPNTLLQSVGFIRADGNYITGLVPVKDTLKKSNLNVDEQAVIQEAQSFNQIDYRIDYVFFRRFSDGRSSQIAAYVVDNSDGKLDKDALSKLHRQVWLQGKAPLLYIAGASQIDILACAREPDFWDNNKQQYQYNPAQTFQKDLLLTAGKISERMKKFSALRLADGTFWDDPDNKNLVNHDKAAHQSLIKAIVETDKAIEGENNPLLRRLFLLMVLIKYLEDRKVFKKGGWFGRFHKGAKRFQDVLKSGEPEKVYKLLSALARKFNGDVFDIAKFSNQQLSESSLREFASFAEAKTIDKQRYLWEQYSFEHLPVEIISHIYQRFIRGGHGAVYTPPFLADLLLDHVMPYKKMTGKERILDPACGSGIFLVGAFKRLINLWRSENNWENPSVDKLKDTLKKCIYGVDLDKNAIDLTAFSLSLAICDALRPNVIWNELQFDYLRDSSLFETDFFELLLGSQNGTYNILGKKFDIVVGNPPFESELSEAAKRVDKKAQGHNLARENCPDNQIAYLFLEQALTLLCPQSGRVCMIQPAGFLYNRNVDSFRTVFFRNCCVETIFDFASIRKLYEAVDPKTVAVFALNNRPASDHNINHWTFRRTVSVKEKICFELDHYDHHRIPQEQGENNPYIWRANLLGGGRLVDISKRFQNTRTFSAYIAKQKDWIYGEGFIAGERKKKKREKEIRKPAPFLTGKPFLPTKAFTNQGIDEDQIGIVTQQLFASPKRQEQFTSPLILIKELDTLPIAFWNKGFLSYRHEIVGVHAPVSDMPKLCELYKYLRRRHHFLRFMVTLYGSRAFIAKSTSILKQDIDILPYPEDEKDLSLSFWEKILCDEAINNMADYIRIGQNSDLLQKSANKNVLCQYSEMFIKMLGSIYGDLKASNPIFLNSLICQPFYFGDSPELEWIDKDAEPELTKLVYYEKHAHLRTVRVVRFYDRNVILIIKPDRLRYWIRSMAIRDADETLADLYNQGY
jgi:methylase of polypeptide subunit release factors